MATIVWNGLLLVFLSCSIALPIDEEDDANLHVYKGKNENFASFDLDHERESKFWEKKGRNTVKEHVESVFNSHTAKNVILFVGDGMSLSTLTAARMIWGKSQYNGISEDGKILLNPGEESSLPFEKFPITGLVKTYCVDSTVADSACSATAYLCGVKANEGTIGVNARINLGDCEGIANQSNYVYSIAKKFLDKGRSAGLVTTTRVTDASPAGLYAHVAHRDWENDAIVKKSCGRDSTNKDIAYQLINEDVGKQLKVILGGGRREFLPENYTDEDSKSGRRTDNLNLIDAWKIFKSNKSHEYISSRDQLQNLNNDTEYLLGLFESSHLKYSLNSNENVPTLREMLRAAIKVLSKSERGYFLFVEGGRIDHAHHNNMVDRAIEETIEFSKAVAEAVKLTRRDDTLLVVTSDHGHAMTLVGHLTRGSQIIRELNYADDGVSYLPLGYANGPGYRKDDPGRYDVAAESIENYYNYKYPSMVPLSSATHSGEDVAVFALGPQQQIFTGNYEQSAIPYLIEYAACLEGNENFCKDKSTNIVAYPFLTLMFIAIVVSFIE